MSTRLIFINLTEDGEEYGHHSSLEAALPGLHEFPNDTIVVRLVPATAAYGRYIADDEYTLDDALRDGLTDEEHGLLMKASGE